MKGIGWPSWSGWSGWSGCEATRGQPDTSIVLTPPAVDPGISDDERRIILELMAKGADVVQEPIDQPCGVRDCAFRHPAGNFVRITQAIA